MPNREDVASTAWMYYACLIGRVLMQAVDPNATTAALSTASTSQTSAIRGGKFRLQGR